MGDENDWARLHEILCEGDAGLLVYVYRLDRRGRRQKPYMLRTYPYGGLLERLRDEFGGGDFGILIRDGRTMVLSGEFSVEPPRQRYSLTSGRH